jgi:hypothetical protein
MLILVGFLFSIVAYLGLVLGSLLVLVLGLVTIREGFEMYEEYTAIEDLPVSSMDAIALGRAAVTGTARPDVETERVPIGEQCDALVYDLTVTDTNKTEDPHVDERVGSPFYLADEHGRVRVDPADLTFDLSSDRTWSREVASHESIPPDLETFVREHDLPEQGFDRDRSFEYEYVAPGDELFVYGRAVPGEDRAGTPEKAVLLTAHDRMGGFLTDKSRETLLGKRQGRHLRKFAVGTVEAVVGLAAFLWLSGIAQLFLGA